jgi:hypothetical protein
MAPTMFDVEAGDGHDVAVAEALKGRPADAPPPRQWQQMKDGRDYVPRPMIPGARRGSGIIFRQDGETVEQALARDAARETAKQQGADRRPKPKSKRPPMPEAPKAVDLKELERTIAEALKAPAIVCATFGDEWAANHFTASGPYLARNLIVASEHNPWLRKKLEEAATGQDAMMIVVSLVGVGGALFSYAIPPIIWWFNLPVSDQARQMFGIPARRKPTYAATPESPEPAPSAVEPEPVAA